MRNIQDWLTHFRELALPRNEVCITGSAALAIWDEVARERHLTPILPEGRIIGDVDIYTGRLGNTFSTVVHNANFAATHVAGSPDCVTFDLDGQHYDVSCEWPFMVASTGKLEDVSADVCGLRVMTIGRVADSKRRFARPKDEGDLHQIDIAFGFRRG